MSAMKEIQNSMAAAAIITSLSNSFRLLPLSAIPPMLDCILASTSLSPSSLFYSLLDDLANLIEGANADGKLDSDHHTNFASVVGALCHLLTKGETNHEGLQSFLWKGFIPLMKMGHEFDRELLNQIADSFFDVVQKTNAWEVLEATLVPFFLRSVGISAGIIQNEELDGAKWYRSSVFQVSNDLIEIVAKNKDYMLSPNRSFSVPLSCHILSIILDAALRAAQASPAADSFTAKLLWNLCNVTERLLLQSLENRSCTIGFLLPVIFKAFVSHSSFSITVNGETHILSRNHFFKGIWICCRRLFSLGSLERRDAYSILSLYLSYFSCTTTYENTDMSDGAEEFDIRSEKELWNEIKRGLVDEEGLVRKQSLHILKTVLCMSSANQCHSGISEKKSEGKHSGPHGVTKRDRWAYNEAKSLGVVKLCNSVDSGLNSWQQWEAFLLLFEMLEEYGTHLVEAAWNHQIALLLQFSVSCDNFVSAISRGVHQNQSETWDEVFSWLSILWKRGFSHDNPQVRCMIMQSFLGLEWTKYGSCSKSVPESFILGPLMDALNDPVHHNDFGVKGVYSSKTIQGAAQFLQQYSSYLDMRERIVFLTSLASLAKRKAFSRAGLMGLAECIAASAVGACKYKVKPSEDGFVDKVQLEHSLENFPHDDGTELLDVFKYVLDSSKQHFNPNYRFRVCEKVLKAAALLLPASHVPLEILLHFISTLPRELTDYGGSLRGRVQDWLLQNHHTAHCSVAEMQLLESIIDFPKRFIMHRYSDENFNDEDLDAWELEVTRWARVFFLVIKEEHQLVPLLTLIQNHGKNICKQINHSEWIPAKFLTLILGLIQEIQVMQSRTAKHGVIIQTKSENGVLETEMPANDTEALIIKMFTDPLLCVLEELVCFAELSCSIFSSSSEMENEVLPSSVRGKLGGPSQRRLSNSLTTAVLQATMSVKAVACVSAWCGQLRSDVLLNSAFTFVGKFFYNTIASPTCTSETEAEVHLAAYEALAPALKALVSSFSPQTLGVFRESCKLLLPAVQGEPWLDSLVLSFSRNINDLLAVRFLARTRRAVLLNWKWVCLESLLSIPYYAFAGKLQWEGDSVFFSYAAVRDIFADIVESLENAGEGSVLPMLRSIRLALELFASGRLFTDVSRCSGVDSQMIWRLVHSSWILNASCNKRRVAPIAALLSSVLHPSLFSDGDMHDTDNEPGPLKWFVEKLLEEGTKSPRTIRLAALHLTGLWLSHPRTIKYYIKELKLLTLYGSVAFDEDFEAELTENHDARTEVALLARIPDPELTEAFINTELYARVSVAVLFYKLSESNKMVGSSCRNEDYQAALEAGKLFLLELLDSVMNDKDLAKELYKKYSAIHRRKIRAWQMICVLSQFVDDDVVGEVSHCLHTALYRNNLPSVRQYLETFAISIYLKFPSLVAEQLVPILRDYDMRPQALSSYVFIAANVILHASEEFRFRHLDELLPPILPLLTSHHHSLRGFTQVLVHQVLCKFFPPMDPRSSEFIPLEKRCFEDLRLYLANNSDCMRLRASMEGYLDAYNPKISVTPAGIFVSRVEEVWFECVPTSHMEKVLNFLNKKITFAKHEKQDMNSSSLLSKGEVYKQLLEMEKEDNLVDQLLKSRSMAMEWIRGNRQHIILVASLIDRIPNLAGLARTCEVFKASGLAVADTKVIHDKQFQLISVTAEKWVPIIEVPVHSVKKFLEKKKREGFSILGLEQTANSIPLDQYIYPKKTVLVLGREKEGIPVDIIHILDACIEIPQLGVVRSLNVHVSGAIALWEYTRQQRS
ncbi:tRNA/rRNA methyltransferase, SpoU [Corchorus capsularis]|uniref:tRNA (guanosine(18)-2'-O)-methyltransferase TARBP1 n=1 Tax=Corchorus capsularis TaxID=210143 RepID=A0A1R3JN75_COCAP|nr:tRNA/rRNA methyltransferase, SpoU [Corchorus capsularis]